MQANPTYQQERAIAIWLLICCAMIFGMVVLGGLTRLTGSGLSMVEWNPIFGFIPPLSHADWMEVFTKYQQSPEFLHVNYHIDLEGFKSIYWFEFWHRVLGRTIGTVFLLPFLYFLWRGWVRKPLIPKFITMFVLGGLQGLLGWYMVMSGLVDNPHVSQYRLTAHLLAAFIIYVFILWVALDLWFRVERHRLQALVKPGIALATLIFITIGSGGLVAGLKAGYAYNTFPLMDGKLIPETYAIMEPMWKNWFENIAAVQFDHRLLAVTTLVCVLGFWVYALKKVNSPRAKTGLHLMAIMVLIQAGMGIHTLLNHVPIAWASAHQAGALVLLSLAVFTLHALSNEQKQLPIA